MADTERFVQSASYELTRLYAQLATVCVNAAIVLANCGPDSPEFAAADLMPAAIRKRIRQIEQETWVS